MKISIITVVLNNVENIEECIKSVLDQTYKNIEYIIIDGGSTDGSIDIIRNYGDKIAYWISEPDQGIYDALNKGIRMARGDVIGILHSDDLFADNFVVETVVNCFFRNGVDSCYGDLVYVSRDDTQKVARYWKADEFKREKFKFGWMPPHPTFFVKRIMYERYGLFNLAMGTAADYELMLRFLFKHRISTIYIPKILVKMRIGGKSNKALKNRIIANRNDVKAWEVNGLKPPMFLRLMKPLRKLPQFLQRP